MKRIIYILLLMMGVLQTNAQIPQWALDIANQQAIQDTVATTSPSVRYLDAVIPALSIIRQQYRLTRNGESFGRNNKSYFSESYSLGIKISGGTILYRKVMFPWEGNADYERVNSANQYKPVNDRSLMSSVDGNEWKVVELELETRYVFPFTSDSLLYYHSDAKSDFGLPVDESMGTKQGYIIWAYSTTGLEDSTMQVKFQQSEFKTEASAKNTSVKVKPADIDNVLGGVFIVPQVERAGYIKVMLVGVTVKTDQDGWTLKMMTKNQNNLGGEGKENEDKDKKRKKRTEDEKNSPHYTDESGLTPIK
ncbi:MAG: hypothetical protein IKG99_05800 [Bacteroidaceae bacterium]|nr:hypothetical protein [Bacteroidaceae bacterium]